MYMGKKAERLKKLGHPSRENSIIHIHFIEVTSYDILMPADT